MRRVRLFTAIMGIATLVSLAPARSETIIDLSPMKCSDDGGMLSYTHSSIAIEVAYASSQAGSAFLFLDDINCKMHTRNRYAAEIDGNGSVQAQIAMDGKITVSNGYPRAWAKLVYGALLWLADGYTIFDENGKPVVLPKVADLH